MVLYQEIMLKSSYEEISKKLDINIKSVDNALNRISEAIVLLNKFTYKINISNISNYDLD